MRCFLFALLLSLTARLGAETPRSIHLVLDCSASMWNKLEDGRYRIDGAKDVLIDFLSTTAADPGLHVGIRIYGSKVHFSKPGACDDSELFVPVEGFQRAELIRAVRSARAIGATPLAKSLELAAADFSQPGKRSLIVCTDGEESCGGDVQAAIAALKEAGVDVDVRVIGIGLPEAAAGRFADMGVPVSNVNSTDAFAQALSSAVGDSLEVSKAPDPVPFAIRLIKNGQPASGHSVTFTHSLNGAKVDLEAGDEGVFTGSTVPGTYRAATAPGDRIFDGLAVSVEIPAEFVLDLTEAPKATLTLAPGEAGIGEVITVKFEGAAGLEGEWIGLLPVDAPDGVLLAWADIEGKRSGEITLRAPFEPGVYEARLHTVIGGETVASGKSNPVTVKPVGITLEVPPQVPAASTFQIVWKGPAAPGDWIGFSKAGSADHEYIRYDRPQSSGEPLTFSAPAEPGKYEMRYSNDQSVSIFGRAAFEVVPAEFGLDAPAEAMAGSMVPVSWTGNAAPGAFITIVPATDQESAYADYFSLEGNESPQSLTVPRQAVEAEVRMVSEADGVVLARRPILLTAAAATLEAPESGKASEDIEVAWTGPAGSGDFVTLVKPTAADNAYEGYFTARHGENKNSIRLPEEPGDYEIRYVTAESQVLARVPFRVE